MTGTEYKIPDPGVDFAEIFKGSKFRLISQAYNGDGTYGVVVEADVISNETHEKAGSAGLKQSVSFSEGMKSLLFRIGTN